MDAGAAERVHRDGDFLGADDIHVDDRAKVLRVFTHVVVTMRRRRVQGPFIWRALHIGKAILENLVRLRFDPARDLGLRRAAVGWVVLQAAMLGWIVRRRDDDPVGNPTRAAPIVIENRKRHRRRGCVLILIGDHDVHALRSEHFQRARLRRDGQGVSIHAEEQRTVDSLRAAIQADRLCDREDVRLVERVAERRTAMARRAERDPLPWHRWVWNARVVRGDEPRHVYQRRRRYRLSRISIHS